MGAMNTSLEDIIWRIFGISMSGIEAGSGGGSDVIIAVRWLLLDGARSPMVGV